MPAHLIKTNFGLLHKSIMQISQIKIHLELAIYKLSFNFPGSFGHPENRRSSCWEGKRKSRTKKKINSEQIFPGAFFHTFFRLSSSSRHPPRHQKCQSKFNYRVLVHEKYRVLLKVFAILEFQAVIEVTLFFSWEFFYTFFCLSSSSCHPPRL